MHANSKLIFQKYVVPLLVPGMKILEIGPDAFPSTFRQIAGQTFECWDTLDIYQNDQLTYSNSDSYNFDIADNIYDIVLSGQVIEHVMKPWLWIKELARVTKPNGYIVTINPISWIYHEAPIDCWRIYPDGMKALYDEAGINVIFSKWESLELPGYYKYRHGMSLESQSIKKQIVSKLLGRLGLPVERAYDTITIGKK